MHYLIEALVIQTIFSQKIWQTLSFQRRVQWQWKIILPLLQRRLSLVKCETMLGVMYFSLCRVEHTKIERFWKWKKIGKGFRRWRRLKIFGRNLCEFCRQGSCFTSLLEKISGNSIKISVTLNCPYKFGNTMLYHLITEHSNCGILSEIPGELHVKRLFTKNRRFWVLDNIILMGGKGKITFLIKMD